MTEPRLPRKVFNERFYRIADNRHKGTGTPALLFCLHGNHGEIEGRGDIYSIVDIAKWQDLNEPLVVVYPEGILESWNSHKEPPLSPSEKAGTDDVKFLKDLSDHLKAEFGLNRFYITGISNGGQMAYTYTNHHADTVTALGVVASSWTDVHPMAPAVKVPLYHIHGAMDGFLAWDGDGFRNDTPILDDITRWAVLNGGLTTTTTKLDGSKVFDGCLKTTKYRLLAFMGHEWRTDNWDSTAKLMEFFKVQ